MITATFLWVSVGILSILHMSRYSNGLFAYIVIGSFASAFVAYMSMPVTIQIATFINVGLFFVTITEIGVKNSIWMIFAIIEILFFVIYFI